MAIQDASSGEHADSTHLIRLRLLIRFTVLDIARLRWSLSQRAARARPFDGSSAINGQALLARTRTEIYAWAKFEMLAGIALSLPLLQEELYAPPANQATLDHLGIEWIDDEYRHWAFRFSFLEPFRIRPV